VPDIGWRHWAVAVRIDQPDGDDSDARSPDTPDTALSRQPADTSDTLDTTSAAEGGVRDEPAEPDMQTERRARIARVTDNRATVDAAYRAYEIDQACEKIREIERSTVTPAMKRIEAEDPDRHLIGLENRLKGKDRLAEKVAFDVQKKGITVDQAIANVKDPIRFTLGYSEDAYTAGVYADCDRVADQGFELVERRNSWDKEQYKGINSRWRVPENGQLFELQFHTQASFDAKEETHWAYEKLRVGTPTPTEQRELEDYQTQITARVPTPPGAQDIPDYP
jgi:hypothetical protein